MKKTAKKRKTKRTETQAKSDSATSVAKGPSRAEEALTWLGESVSLVPILEKSYVLSRFWAWVSRIEFRPQLRIPVPRYLSYRDP
jgi:hypothetical protein